jgi:hypothetical protein
MATKRQDILDRIKVLIDGITTVKGSEINKSTPVDIETIPLPYVFIFSGPEARVTDERAVIGFETWEWKVVLEVWGRDQDMEALLGEIHSAMYSDYGFSNSAVISYRTGVDMLMVDVEKSLEVMIVDYEVLYRHIKGVM